MNLLTLLQEASVSQSEFARKANIDFKTLQRALRGERIHPRTATIIAETLSSLLGREIKASEIDGIVTV